MFKFNLFRKFLILAVLAGSLFMFSSVNRAAEIRCCAPLWEICFNNHDLCVLSCDTLDRHNYAKCIEDCEMDKLDCLVAAEPCDPDPDCSDIP